MQNELRPLSNREQVLVILCLYVKMYSQMMDIFIFGLIDVCICLEFRCIDIWLYL